MVRPEGRRKDFGVVWAPPFRLDVTDTLKPGENTLEIFVANQWPNRIIGDLALRPKSV